MAKRAGWGSLSPAYRKRLQNKGITRRAYESGASLKPGRGHGTTPEHGQKSRHVEAVPHTGIVEQEVVYHRVNRQWYRSDIRRAIGKVRPNTQNQLRIAIVGTIQTDDEDWIEDHQYKGRRRIVTRNGQKTLVMRTVVGVKARPEDLEIAMERNRIGRYRVDMAGAAEELTGQPFIRVTEISIATGAPPQGKTR